MSSVLPRSSPIKGTNYTVASGDTLWVIARRIRGDNTLSTETLIGNIFAANPHAFVQGDRDRLRLGAELELPFTREITIPSPGIVRTTTLAPLCVESILTDAPFSAAEPRQLAV